MKRHGTANPHKIKVPQGFLALAGLCEISVVVPGDRIADSLHHAVLIHVKIKSASTRPTARSLSDNNLKKHCTFAIISCILF
jgi:hypothetical protein